MIARWRRSKSSICAAKSPRLASSRRPRLRTEPGLAIRNLKRRRFRTRCRSRRRWSVRLRENLASSGQSMVFLNRRGFHNFLQCHICGNVIACQNCSVSMTFHMRDRSLRCHYCGNHTAAPDTCPECKGYGLKGQGFGTERLTQTLAELMPNARIERMDSDTSSVRGARARMLARASRRRNRYPGRHADDHQGFRFSRRHAGRGGERRHGAEHARLPFRRAHVPVADADRGTRGSRRACGPRDYPDLRAASLQHPRGEGSGLRALHAPRARTAPRS